MGAKNFGSFTKYVTLLPDVHVMEEVSFLYLCKQLVYSTDFSLSALLQHNIPKHKEDKHLHRKSIIISIIIQKFLMIIDTFWKNLGIAIENFLNGNTFRREKIKEDNEGFISVLGHIDNRIKLDEDVKHGDARYHPALSMMASKLAYENELVIQKTVLRHLKMDYVKFFDCYNDYERTRTTQAFMMCEKTTNGKIIVAFRGTSPFEVNDAITDIDFSWCKIKGMGKLHKGFLLALGLQNCDHEDDDPFGDYRGYFPKQIKQDHNNPFAYYEIREKLKEIIGSNKKAKYILTGHSLGGALAILFPAVLALHGEVELLDKLEAIYTFGQPRVGDEEFGMFMKIKLREHNIKYYRIVYGHDVVPWVPLDNAMMTFKHFGTSIHFNCLYHGKIVEEEQTNPVVEKQTLLKSFFGMLRETVAAWRWLVLGRLEAVWELIRGLMIGFTAGPYYQEGWLLTGFRIFGIILPEVVDHSPRDYLNATLLASEDLFNYHPALY